MIRTCLFVATLTASSACIAADFTNQGTTAAPYGTPARPHGAAGSTTTAPRTTYRNRGTGTWSGSESIIRDRGNGRLTGNDGLILRDRGSGRYTGNDGTTCRDRGNGRILCQ